jgi:hypothetical protein
VIEPWYGLFVAAYVTEFDDAFYGYAKLYECEPLDAWCPHALIKVGSPGCPCPVEALDSALERAFAALESDHSRYKGPLRRRLLLAQRASAPPEFASNSSNASTGLL